MNELAGLARLAVYSLIIGGALLFFGSIFKSNGFGGAGELLLFVTVGGILLLKK